MVNVWFTSDLHFGHRNIQKFRDVESEESNRVKIRADWIRLVTKRDIVYVLGDAAFTEEGLNSLKDLQGKKILIRGNHDLLPISSYLTVFDEVYGILKYKEFWLSHAPIHPLELRGKKNIHGHVHYQNIPNENYINTSVENIWKLKHRSLISLQEIREIINANN